MAPLNIPVDFDAIRLALVAAVSVATGLPEGQIVMGEPEAMGAPRPRAPYIEIMIITASSRIGFDEMRAYEDAPGERTGKVNIVGPRTMMVSFDCFGKTHEQAYGIMVGLQGALETQPVQEALDQANVSVSQVNDVTDISEALATTFEGRAHLDATFAFTYSATVDLGLIEHVPVTTQVFEPAATLAFQQTDTIDKGN